MPSSFALPVMAGSLIGLISAETLKKVINIYQIEGIEDPQRR
jgi:hypothetical protein